MSEVARGTRSVACLATEGVPRPALAARLPGEEAARDQ
jgi:hypothetical protein